MSEQRRGDVHVNLCPDGHGIFLERADLGALVEAELDWHERAVQDTARLPRITSDMTAPPVLSSQARGWIETLFD
jgi:Zn-finger nucleic acid-binding protein